MDPNRNRSQVAYDALGHVVGIAALGPPEDDLGDSLEGFVADLPEDGMGDLLDDPLADPHALLGGAGTRFVYDVLANRRTKDQPHPTPAATWRMVREQHRSDPAGVLTRLQHVITHCDAFGRQVQAKVLAEPGPVPRRDADGSIVLGPDGRPETTDVAVTPRWTGSGWTIFDNKGRPVRQYEPFFTDISRFEFAVRIGVSPVQFYDPVPCQNSTCGRDQGFCWAVQAARRYSLITPPRIRWRRIGALSGITVAGSWVGGCWFRL
jgi:hypothetical protein